MEQRFIIRHFYFELTKNSLEDVLKAIEASQFYSKEAKEYALTYFKTEYANGRKATFVC